MSSNPEVIVAGHMCLDMFPKFTYTAQKAIADLFKPGTLIKMGEMEFSTGGAVSNTGLAMKVFGINVGFIAKTGDDAIGATILDIMKKHGDIRGIAVVHNEHSSYSVVISPPGIDRIFLHCPGANDTFTSSDIDFSIVKGTKLFHFGYPTLMRSMYADGGEELMKILRNAGEQGAIISLDISLPDPDSDAGKADWPLIYKKALPCTDVFLPSIEEAFFTLHSEEYLERKRAHKGEELIDHFTAREYSDLADEYLSLGCKIVALKSGHNGWYLKTGTEKKFSTLADRGLDAAKWAGKELWCPAFRVEKIASATGSGDSSIAAFLSSIVKGYSLEEALKFANCAGYMNLSSYDATSGLGDWNKMRSLLPSLEVRDIPLLHGTDWSFDNDLRLWRR